MDRAVQGAGRHDRHLIFVSPQCVARRRFGFPIARACATSLLATCYTCVAPSNVLNVTPNPSDISDVGVLPRISPVGFPEPEHGVCFCQAERLRSVAASEGVVLSGEGGKVTPLKRVVDIG